MHAPGGNYSIIIDCFDLAAEAINVTFHITAPSRAGPQRLQQWTTNRTDQFARQADVVPVQGPAGLLSFVVQLHQGA